MILGMIFFSDLIAIVAMPVLSGVLIVVGFQIVKLPEIRAIWGTGKTSVAAMSVTFILTLALRRRVNIFRLSLIPRRRTDTVRNINNILRWFVKVQRW